MTPAALTRRVRESGTLKAFGWRTRRIVIPAEARAGGIGAAIAIGASSGLVGAQT